MRFIRAQLITRLDSTLLVLLLQVLCLALPAARAADGPRAVDEFSRQTQVFGSRGADVPDGYITHRSLAHYRECLPSGFEQALDALGPARRWLDIGAGEGQAILDYQTQGSVGDKARAVALSIEDRRTQRWHKVAASSGDPKIRYVHGKRLREYSVEELGTFDMITDVFGAFSYSADLSLAVEKVLALLVPGGSFYTLIQGVKLESGKAEPDASYLTAIKDNRGQDVSVCTWLKGTSCVQVSCESKPTWEWPTEVIQVRKVCPDVRVPSLLPMTFEAGTPPTRTFMLGK